MSLEKAIEENTKALMALTAALAGGALARGPVPAAGKQDAPGASSPPGATHQTTEVKADAPAKATVLDYEKDIKPVCLQLAAKKGRDALLAVYAETGGPAKDAKPEQYPTIMAALQKALAA